MRLKTNGKIGQKWRTNMQERLGKSKIKYSYGAYNKIKGDQQWIRISEGCIHNCPWCYEPTDLKVLELIERRYR